jgi:hypothetical protein
MLSLTHFGVIALFRPCELLPSLSVRRSTFHILIFSSETTGPIPTKLWWNGPWMVPFQKYVRWPRLPTKMATKLKIEKRGDEILIVHCSNFNCSYMAWSSLTYVRGFCVKFFFQSIYTDCANWAYFDKRSHLNLLWNRRTKLNQTWQGWSLGRSLSKLCPIAMPSIQDGRHY